MAKAMTKAQLVTRVSEKAGITKKAAMDILIQIAEIAYKEAKNSFTLPGIGKLVLVQRKARMGRNPQTGEAIKIPAKKVVKFRIAQSRKGCDPGEEITDITCEQSSAKGPSDLGLEGPFRFERTIFAIVTFSVFNFLYLTRLLFLATRQFRTRV